MRNQSDMDLKEVLVLYRLCCGITCFLEIHLAPSLAILAYSPKSLLLDVGCLFQWGVCDSVHVFLSRLLFGMLKSGFLGVLVAVYLCF